MFSKIISLLCIQFIIACAPSNQKLSVLESNENTGTAIIGGKSVEFGDYKLSSVVGIKIMESFSNQLIAVCTGTLIAQDIVVTAAHCVAEMPASVTFLIYFGTSLTDQKKISAVRTAIKKQIHPKYSVNKEENGYDIALLKISEPAPVYIKPAALMKDSSKIKWGQKLTVAGYGYTSIVDSRNQGIIRNLKQAQVKIGKSWFSETEFQVFQFMNGICSGDSGGPAFLEENGELKLAGITNRAMSNGLISCIISSYFLRVDKMNDWIQQTSKQLH